MAVIAIVTLYCLWLMYKMFWVPELWPPVYQSRPAAQEGPPSAESDAPEAAFAGATATAAAGSAPLTAVLQPDQGVRPESND
jgi:hypothetical protein